MQACAQWQAVGRDRARRSAGHPVEVNGLMLAASGQSAAMWGEASAQRVKSTSGFGVVRKRVEDRPKRLSALLIRVSDAGRSEVVPRVLAGVRKPSLNDPGCVKTLWGGVIRAL